MFPPSPIKLSERRYGETLLAGMGISTILADFDFETYSPAGFIWNKETQKFEAPHGASKKGLPSVGAAVYSEHPDAEVLSMAYDLKDGKGPKLWVPGNPNPKDLFSHIADGKLLEAWNCAFERWIWTNICVSKYGWPPLPFECLRDAMAKSRAHGLPGSLDPAGEVLNISKRKDKRGKALIDLFCIPRNPTKTNPRLRTLLEEKPEDRSALYEYNLRDIEAEAEISSIIPDLIPQELDFWLCDQRINFRGVQIDLEAIANCMTVVEQAHDKYNKELRVLTNNQVNAASEIFKIKNWMATKEVLTDSLDEHNTTLLLKKDLPADVRRVLEIRGLIGSAAVKKLYAMTNQATKRGRLHDLFIYHSARTGRAAGTGPQPQNLPNSGNLVNNCECGAHYGELLSHCPWCNSTMRKLVEWNTAAVEESLQMLKYRNVDLMEYYYNDSISIISGVLRGLFISAPGHDLICSDYSAIEAVVLAALAGEEWRMEVFRSHGKIYEMSASKITGVKFEEYEAYYLRENKKHHPHRKIGKVAELASGYAGWIGAWKSFKADEFFSEEEIKEAILAWRAASPMIVEFWGGQERNWKKEYYGLEGCAVQAVLYPGVKFVYRGISYVVKQDVLYCQLLSGRYLSYHRPRLAFSNRKYRENTYELSYEGWNTNPAQGSMGWIRMQTYSGKLTENVVQATARDLLTHAIVNLEKSGYPVVLHIHDEIVCEVPEGFGSVEELEKIMSTMPSWAENWPIKAKGGWRAKRYSK